MSLRKSVFRTAGRLGLASTLALGGCLGDRDSVPGSAQTSEHGGVGNVDLSLVLPDGSDVSDPTYAITRPSEPSFPAVNGTLAIGSGGVASASITGLPVGTGFHVAVTALRTIPAGAPACAGQADFEVLARAATVVNVVLHCDDTSTDTNVTINGTLNICPKISASSLTPSSTSVGSSVALSAVVSDRDGDPISYRWLADGVEFATTAAASYSCVAAGEHSINLTVSDGPSRGCSKSLPAALVVTCTGADGGSATDAGAIADAGADDAAVDAAADAGAVDAGADAAADAGLDAADDAGADTGTGADAGADTGTGVDAGSDAGSSWPLGSAECAQCQRDNCTAYSLDSIDTLGGCSDSLCRALVACTLNADCFTSTADIPRCFCGEVSTDACLATGYVLAGPCLELTQQGLDTTDKQAIFERTVNPAYAAGRGYQLVTCIADVCQTACL